MHDLALDPVIDRKSRELGTAIEIYDWIHRLADVSVFQVSLRAQNEVTILVGLEPRTTQIEWDARRPAHAPLRRATLYPGPVWSDLLLHACT